MLICPGQMAFGDLPATAMFLVHIFVFVFVFVIVIVNCSCSLLDISKDSEGGWLMYSEAGAWCCNVYGAFILLLFCNCDSQSSSLKILCATCTF